MVYLKGYDKIAFVEQGSKCLKLCSPDMQPFFDIKDFSQTPLCAEYINKCPKTTSKLFETHLKVA